MQPRVTGSCTTWHCRCHYTPESDQEGCARRDNPDALYAWRRDTKRKHYPNSIFSPQAILNDSTCALLASVGPICSKARLQEVLLPSWQRWDKLSDELYVMLSALNPPSEPAPISNAPSEPRSTARSVSSASAKRSAPNQAAPPASAKRSRTAQTTSVKPSASSVPFSPYHVFPSTPSMATPTYSYVPISFDSPAFQAPLHSHPPSFPQSNPVASAPARQFTHPLNLQYNTSEYFMYPPSTPYTPTPPMRPPSTPYAHNPTPYELRRRARPTRHTTTSDTLPEHASSIASGSGHAQVMDNTSTLDSTTHPNSS